MMIESNNNPRGIDIAGLLKESAIAALVALGLTIVMLGLRT